MLDWEIVCQDQGGQDYVLRVKIQVKISLYKVLNK